MLDLFESKANLNEKFELYMKNNENSIKELEKTEKCQKDINEINKFIKENIELISLLSNFYYRLFFYTFKDFFLKEVKKNDILYDIYDFLKQNIELFNEIFKPDYIQFIDQNFIFILNLIRNEKEILLRDKIDRKYFQLYEEALNTDDKMIWTIYEKELNKYDAKDKYIKVILEGKKTDKEKYKFDCFYIINKTDANNKGMNGVLIKSIFNGEQVLIIKINLYSNLEIIS